MGRALRLTSAGLVAVLALPSGAATKHLDLDGQASNGLESQADVNVLQTFPVRIENVLTNRTLGDAFDFAWPSAGPGGFTSRLAPGTASGVGTRWTWSTHQTVYAYTGTTCASDLCLLQTSGPDMPESVCSEGCSDDGVSLSASRSETGGVALGWAGGAPLYRVHRSPTAAAIHDPANVLVETSALQYDDMPPAADVTFYRIRGATCLTPKPCETAADCAETFDGLCVSRGPFSVPGRTVLPGSVTLSSATLTSSLVTFFSPPTELFRITTTAGPGSFRETLLNLSTSPITVSLPASPPRCVPPDCLVPASTVTVPPGASTSVCRTGGSLYQEVPVEVRVCGEGIPGPTGPCGEGAAGVTTGPFLRLLPDGGIPSGVRLTPFAVDVVDEDDGDGNVEPGETATLRIALVNAGLTAVTSAAATLVASPVDLTDDGVKNPVTVTVLNDDSAYGTISGAEPDPDCDPVVPSPAWSALPFRVVIPAAHPPDTATPLALRLTGTAGGNPFVLDVPIALGIGHP